jgi:RimJ/RimL family protein N-acetyltransferase
MFLERSYADGHMFTFAIIDIETAQLEGDINSGKGDELVGMVSLVNADTENRSVAIGLLHILPEAQGKGYGSHAGQLLLEYGMCSPAADGLGLGRMEWRSNTMNEPSIKLAQRLGFRMVGLIKYERLPKDGIARGKVGNGRPPPVGTSDKDLWRDIVIYEMSCDDWTARRGYPRPAMLSEAP